MKPPMSQPSTTPNCPKCGQPTRADRLGGLCPRCISRVAVRGSSPAAGAGAVPMSHLRFGPYELSQELGRGAMGAVYRAHDPVLGRDVALKIILSGQFASTEERRRFLAEAEHVARLDHPNIVPIYQTGETEGRAWFAMKLIEGTTLKAGPSATTVASLMATLARAVQHAHERGVLHRDLKPGNILLDREGVPHITDFGLARRLDLDSSLTLSGSPVGTPGYMAPELVRCAKDATTAADIWSLGVMLYELLAGRLPFAGATVSEMLWKIAEEEPGRITKDELRITSGGAKAGSEARSSPLTGSAVRDLEVVALKCLRKDPTQRYASAAALAEDLEKWQRGEPIAARAVGTTERLWRWTRRHPLVAVLSAALVVAVVTGTVLLALANQRLSRALARAHQAERTARTHLHTALLAQVRARRGLNTATPHAETIAVIAEAARLNPSLDTRNEAVIALAARDRDAGRSNSVPAAVFREFAPTGATSQGCSLDVSPDGSLVVAGTHDGLDLWDVRTGAHLSRQRQGGLPWMTANFAPDGTNVVFSARTMGVMTLPVARRENSDGVTLETGPLGRRGRLFDSTVQSISRDGHDWLVALDRNPIYITKLVVWRDGDPATARVVAEGEPMTWSSLSPDGKWLASTLVPAADVRLWDTATAKPTRQLGLHGALLAVFTPDGRHLVTRDASEYAVWRVGSWTKVTAWPAETTSLAARIRFSPDGRFMAVLQGNDRVQILRTTDWSEAVTLIGPVPMDLMDVTWNAKGDGFYLLTREGQVREWNLGPLHAQLRGIGLDWE